MSSWIVIERVTAEPISFREFDLTTKNAPPEYEITEIPPKRFAYIPVCISRLGAIHVPPFPIKPLPHYWVEIIYSHYKNLLSVQFNFIDPEGKGGIQNQKVMFSHTINYKNLEDYESKLNDLLNKMNSHVATEMEKIEHRQAQQLRSRLNNTSCWLGSSVGSGVFM